MGRSPSGHFAFACPFPIRVSRPGSCCSHHTAWPTAVGGAGFCSGDMGNHPWTAGDWATTPRRVTTAPALTHTRPAASSGSRLPRFVLPTELWATAFLGAALYASLPTSFFRGGKKSAPALRHRILAGRALRAETGDRKTGTQSCQAPYLFAPPAVRWSTCGTPEFRKSGGATQGGHAPDSAT